MNHIHAHELDVEQPQNEPRHRNTNMGGCMIRGTSSVPLALVLLAGLVTNSQTTGGFNGFQYVDKTGNIRKAADFRDHYELLGAWWVADPTGNQMHITYASPGAAEYSAKTESSRMAR